LTLVRSRVIDNTSRGVDRGGGGIDNRGRLTATGSAISGNRTNEFGGGLYNSGTANLTDATLASNLAALENDGSGDGGGIFNATGAALVLTDSAVTDTTAPHGGGLYNS